MLRAVATSTGICIGSPMTVKPHTYYNYSAKLYRSDLQGTAYFNLLDASQADIPGTQMGKDVAGQWVEVSQVFYSGDRTTVYPRCVVDNALSGAPMYFDDIRFTEIAWDDNKSFPVGVTLSDVDAVYQIGSANTKATIAVANNNHYITSLSTGATGATQWVTEAIRAPLVNVVNSQSVDWQYVTSGVTSITNGQELKIEFESPDGALSLNAYWTARSGVGPIEYRQEILSDTQSVSVRYPTRSAPTSAWNRTATRPCTASAVRVSTTAPDPYFSQGDSAHPAQLRQPGADLGGELLHAGRGVSCLSRWWMWTATTASISATTGASAKILFRMNNEGHIGVTTYLDDSAASSITRSAGTAVEIPGFFIGTYEGDLDDGSNDMKNWFWDYKITRSLQQRGRAHDRGRHHDRHGVRLQNVVNIWPDIEDYIRVVKMDYPWTVPEGYAPRQDVTTEDLWLPDATRYPNGHNLWSAIRAHSPNMRFRCIWRIPTRAWISARNTGATCRFRRSRSGSGRRTTVTDSI